MRNSIYFVDTIIALERDEYISPNQMLASFKNYPYFDREHARTEIIKAKQHYDTH